MVKRDHIAAWITFNSNLRSLLISPYFVAGPLMRGSFCILIFCYCSTDALSQSGAAAAAAAAAAASDAALLGYPCREGVPLHLLYPPASFASGLAGLALTSPLTSHGVTSAEMTSPTCRDDVTNMETSCTCECGRD